MQNSKAKTTIEVISDEDGERFVCIGTQSKRKALAAIRKYQRVECGLDPDCYAKLDDLELTPVWRAPSPEYPNEEWMFWGEKPEGGRFIGSGWLHKIF